MIETVKGTNRRLVARGAVGAVAVLGLAGGLVACGGSSTDQSVRVEVGDPTEPAAAALTRASDATGAVESGRVTVISQVQGETDGTALDGSFTASGSFADGGRQAELTIDMTALMGSVAGTSGDAPRAFVMREIVDGTTSYVKIDMGLDTGGMGLDKWVKIDLATMSGGGGGVGGALGGSVSGGLNGSTGLGGGPDGLLESLKGAGATVAETGTDTIDGVAVTVYEGEIDPNAAVAAAAPDKVDQVRDALGQLGMTSPIPFTAWVDDQGLVRRMDMKVAVDRGSATVQMTMRVEFSDFGAPITITPPPADEVLDMSNLSSMFGGFGKTGTA
jgi:hypothetical protein